MTSSIEIENMVLTHIEAGVLTITLNRPDRLNSFNDEMHGQLSAALKMAERDENVRCVLLTGAGRGFCAGQDLNDRNVSVEQAAPELGLSVERFYTVFLSFGLSSRLRWQLVPPPFSGSCSRHGNGAIRR